MFLMGFSLTAEDNKLDKEKTNELVAAMYSARQSMLDTRRMPPPDWPQGME